MTWIVRNINHLPKLADPSQTFLEQIAVFILSYVVFVYLDMILCVHTIMCCIWWNGVVVSTFCQTNIYVQMLALKPNKLSWFPQFSLLIECTIVMLVSSNHFIGLLLLFLRLKFQLVGSITLCFNLFNICLHYLFGCFHGIIFLHNSSFTSWSANFPMGTGPKSHRNYVFMCYSMWIFHLISNGIIPISPDPPLKACWVQKVQVV
jgi:hypothetical protein